MRLSRYTYITCMYVNIYITRVHVCNRWFRWYNIELFMYNKSLDFLLLGYMYFYIFYF